MDNQTLPNTCLPTYVKIFTYYLSRARMGQETDTVEPVLAGFWLGCLSGKFVKNQHKKFQENLNPKPREGGGSHLRLSETDNCTCRLISLFIQPCSFPLSWWANWYDWQTWSSKKSPWVKIQTFDSHCSELVWHMQPQAVFTWKTRAFSWSDNWAFTTLTQIRLLKMLVRLIFPIGYVRWSVVQSRI